MHYKINVLHLLCPVEELKAPMKQEFFTECTMPSKLINKNLLMTLSAESQQDPSMLEHFLCLQKVMKVIPLRF